MVTATFLGGLCGIGDCRRQPNFFRGLRGYVWINMLTLLPTKVIGMLTTTRRMVKDNNNDGKALR